MTIPGTPKIASVAVAVELYYSTYALYTCDIQRLFPTASRTTVSRLKAAARDYTRAHGLLLIDNQSAPTDDAYKAWGLDIAALEAKYKKLKRLGLIPEPGVPDAEAEKEATV